jgi:hypothetical protein
LDRRFDRRRTRRPRGWSRAGQTRDPPPRLPCDRLSRASCNRPQAKPSTSDRLAATSTFSRRRMQSTRRAGHSVDRGPATNQLCGFTIRFGAQHCVLLDAVKAAPPIFCSHGWESGLKCGARTGRPRGPYASTMSLDDGTADGKSHAHATRLSRVEGFEHTVETFRIQSWTGIRHCHDTPRLSRLGRC